MPKCTAKICIAQYSVHHRPPPHTLRRDTAHSPQQERPPHKHRPRRQRTPRNDQRRCRASPPSTTPFLVLLRLVLPSSEFTLSGSFAPPCPFDVASTDAAIIKEKTSPSPPSTSHSTHPRGRSPRLRRARSNRRVRRSIGRRSIGWWAGRGKHQMEGAEE
ncbi:hypothetical protein B0H14DRAFT_2741143 [Mycena olivaceomarginata]|nr:hypothetical protein B0H14DRAFT_2741143 [Mycena olivaceomarginata]